MTLRRPGGPDAPHRPQAHRAPARPDGARGRAGRPRRACREGASGRAHPGLRPSGRPGTGRNRPNPGPVNPSYRARVPRVCGADDHHRGRSSHPARGRRPPVRRGGPHRSAPDPVDPGRPSGRARCPDPASAPTPGNAASPRGDPRGRQGGQSWAAGLRGRWDAPSRVSNPSVRGCAPRVIRACVRTPARARPGFAYRLSAASAVQEELVLGWCVRTRRGVRVRVLPGDLETRVADDLTQLVPQVTRYPDCVPQERN